MAENKAASTQSPKKKRSPVERAIVWGLIGVLLLVVLWEGFARFGYERTLARWQAAIEAAESGEGDGSLKLAEAEEMIIGFPSRSSPQEQGGLRIVDFKWNSLFKRNYAISVTYGGDPPDVLGLQTANAPEEEIAEYPADGTDEEDEDEEEGESGESADPRGSGGRRGGDGEGRPQGGRPSGDAPAEAPSDDAPVENAPPDDGPTLGRDPQPTSDSDRSEPGEIP